jgi:glycosyltransferase involved in cell wall biosynthesis
VKLRHLACIARPAAWPGITRRLAEQARAARDAGLDLRFTVLACEPCAIPGVDCMVIGPWERYARCRAILRRGLLDDCDAAILRYPTALDVAIAPLLDRHGHRLVSEHHTDEVAELRLVGSRLGGALSSLIEARRKPAFLSRLAGVIAVTEELRQLESAAAPALPSTVIANGIDTLAQPAHGPARFAGGPLRLVWACSEFAPWQGLDRLIAALAKRRSGPVVELALAGRLGPQQVVALQQAGSALLRIHSLGLVDQVGIDGLLRSAHLVVGTLALHRKRMREACPLKVREAVARGLPVITACIDPDLPLGLPGILRLSPGETPLDGDALVEQATGIAGDASIPAALRDHACAVMDWRPKLRQMAAFVHTTIKR